MSRIDGQMDKLTDGEINRQSMQMQHNISCTRNSDRVLDDVVETVDMSGILGRLATRGDCCGSSIGGCLATGDGSSKWMC